MHAKTHSLSAEPLIEFTEAVTLPADYGTRKNLDYKDAHRGEALSTIFRKIISGRTDLISDYLATGNPHTATDPDGVAIIKWCARYGDVTAVRQLLEEGESLTSLGSNFDLNGAAFHGHWQLCQFLLESGADPKYALPDSGETALHAALCGPDEIHADRVVEVLLGHGADASKVTVPGVVTGCLMRDARTRGEGPLHRAAAFGTENSIQLLLNAGAATDQKDANGDSALSWASWHRRPDSILRLLLYGDFAIHPDRQPMRVNLKGQPQL